MSSNRGRRGTCPLCGAKLCCMEDEWLECACGWSQLHSVRDDDGLEADEEELEDEE